jgi:hypothetical protein
MRSFAIAPPFKRVRKRIDKDAVIVFIAFSYFSYY